MAKSRIHYFFMFLFCWLILSCGKSKLSPAVTIPEKPQPIYSMPDGPSPLPKTISPTPTNIPDLGMASLPRPNFNLGEITPPPLPFRTYVFSQGYGTRCPSDRVFVQVSFSNSGDKPRTFKFSGSVTPSDGDGSCYMSYASLGLVAYRPIASFTIVNPNLYAITPTGMTILLPGQSIVYTADGGIAGGRGLIDGNLIYDTESFGTLVPSGSISMAIDSLPNSPSSFNTFTINGGTGF